MADRDQDEAAIGEALKRLAQAFGHSTTDGLAELYADDADWTNAFGTTRHGREAILAYLTELFDDPCFTAGRLTGRPEASIRFVDDDVAIAKTYAEREGQQTRDGQPMPIRRNFSIKVFQRQEASWRIVSDLYMDARRDPTAE